MSRFSLRPLIIGLLVGLFAAAAFSSGTLASWSARISDRFFTSRAADPAIVIVAIDDASLQRVGRWPWDRSVHADLIRRLTLGHPAAIGYDVNFPEAQDEENDRALTSAVRDAGTVVFPVELTLVPGVDGRPASDPNGRLAPIPSIAETAAGLGHTNVTPDTDGVVRRLPLDIRSSIPTVSATQPAFAQVVASVARRSLPYPTIPQDAQGFLRVSFPDAPGKAFPVIPAADVLDGKIDTSRFTDKIVLVGATARDLHDEQLVSVSGGASMPGVEIHASLLDTLLSRHWLRQIPPTISIAFLIVLGIVTGLLFSWFRARWALPLVGVLWLGVLVGAFYLFDRGWIVDVFWPTIALFAACILIAFERRFTAEIERRAVRSLFSRYVSPSVVEAILEDPSKLELGGERRRMTVFFSDIRGFTTLAEGMSPEKLVRVLNTYLDRMTNIVFAHGGVLDKYIGDAVMAFWNAPFDQPDHARRAVVAALAMRDALHQMNTDRSFGGTTLKIGAGINTGDMVVGNIGGKARHDYTVIGDNVNLASRVEGLTKEYGVEILITGSTADEAGSEIVSRRLDLVVVKGKTEPVPVHEVMCLASQATSAILQLVADYEAAFVRYLTADFVGAAAACADILSRHPEDGPTTLLLSRSAQFIKEPPAKGWNGAWVYTKK